MTKSSGATHTTWTALRTGLRSHLQHPGLASHSFGDGLPGSTARRDGVDAAQVLSGSEPRSGMGAVILGGALAVLTVWLARSVAYTSH